MHGLLTFHVSGATVCRVTDVFDQVRTANGIITADVPVAQVINNTPITVLLLFRGYVCDRRLSL